MRSDGHGSLSKSQHKKPSTTTLRGSYNSPARTPSAYQMSRRPGTPSHGRLQCDYATTSPSSRLPKRSSRTQSPLPTSYPNQSARRSNPTRTRARSKARAKAKPRTKPTHGSTSIDNNLIRAQSTPTTPSLQHHRQHNQHTHTDHTANHILPVPSQGTAQGQEEQAITEPQRQRQTTTKIGTAQRLGRSIPAS